jgi:hypothetical protein
MHGFFLLPPVLEEFFAWVDSPESRGSIIHSPVFLSPPGFLRGFWRGVANTWAQGAEGFERLQKFVPARSVQVVVRRSANMGSGSGGAVVSGVDRFPAKFRG